MPSSHAARQGHGYGPVLVSRERARSTHTRQSRSPSGPAHDAALLLRIKCPTAIPVEVMSTYPAAVLAVTSMPGDHPREPAHFATRARQGAAFGELWHDRDQPAVSLGLMSCAVISSRADVRVERRLPRASSPRTRTKRAIDLPRIRPRVDVQQGNSSCTVRNPSSRLGAVGRRALAHLYAKSVAAGAIAKHLSWSCLSTMVGVAPREPGERMPRSVARPRCDHGEPPSLRERNDSRGSGPSTFRSRL